MNKRKKWSCMLLIVIMAFIYFMYGLSLLDRNIEVVYAIDSNYLKYFYKSVESVLKHNPYAHITVVSNEKLDIPYDVVVMKLPRRMKLRKEDRLTDATYLRLLLPNLPYKKVIYMDADVINQAPLTELWRMKCDYICLAETFVYGKVLVKSFNHEKYADAGVMLMNLDALRKDNFIEKAFEPFDTEKYDPWFHDETIINHRFYDKLTFIDQKYNYCHKKRYERPIPESDVVNLHYIGRDKSDMFKHK